MTEVERPTAAFVLSLIAGIFIVLGGGMTSMMGSFFGPYGYGIMGGYGGFGMMGYGYSGYGNGYGVTNRSGFGLFGVLGLVFGVIVIVSAIMLNSRPQEHSTWGVLIVIFSVLSIFGGAMGGLGAGLILGIVGGVLAITWKTTQTQTKTQ
jgi:hypothetical protein